MKLINRTGLPDAPLHAMLAAAGRSVGARTSHVVVMISNGNGTSGVAYRATSVRWGGRRRLATDGGAFRACLPRRVDPLDSALELYRTAAHEWVHIRDYQRGERFSRRRGTRRPKHRQRIEEKRVYERLAEVSKRGRGEVYDTPAIVALAIAIEDKAGQL